MTCVWPGLALAVFQDVNGDGRLPVDGGNVVDGDWRAVLFLGGGWRQTMSRGRPSRRWRGSRRRRCQLRGGRAEDDNGHQHHRRHPSPSIRRHADE